MDRALIFAVVGGGDVATATLLKNVMEKCFESILVGSIPWERFKYDPVPGPIRYEEVYNAKLYNGYMLVNSDSYAVRGGRKIRFQAVKASKILGEEVAIVSPTYGFEQFVNGLKKLMEDKNLDTFIAVDVGGDILAEGYEEDLWSPLADSFGLAAAYKLKEMGFKSLVAVASPSADGELPWNVIKERLSRIYKEGYVERVLGLGNIDLAFYSQVLTKIDTEASRMAYEALTNGFGTRIIRGGSREVSLDIHTTLVFYIDPEGIFKYSRPAKHVYKSTSFDDANKRLLEDGIPTEYELEKIISGLIGEYVDEKNLYIIARKKLMELVKRRRP